MPITEQERIDRREHIGSSDLPAIMGVCPFSTAEDVRLEKLGRLAPQEETDVMNAGTWLEEGVLKFAESRLGPINFHPGTKQVEGSNIWVNTDGLLIESEIPVEAKTARLFGWTTEEWGEDGTDEVPNRVIIQATAHMMAWDREICYVPVLLGGSGFRMYKIKRSAELVKAILFRADEFWTYNVLEDQPCADVAPTITVIKRMKIEPEKITDIAASLVQKWNDDKDVFSEAKKAVESSKAAVLGAIGDAEAAHCGDLGAVTNLIQHKKAFNTKASSCRVLRHKKKGL